MSVLEAALIILAGMAAGTINTIVGSGTLVTFPTLLFFGYPAVTANVSNTIGLVFGGLTGVAGYRKELVGQGATLRRLVPMSLIGATIGALLLLVLPPEAFNAIVPALILLGILLVIFGKRIQRWAAAHHTEDGAPSWHLPVMMGGVLLAGVYGGYFGAAQGVILMGLLSSLSTLPLQSLNGIKNVLATVANAVAAVVFIVVARDQVDWAVAALIAVGAIMGGVIGSTVGRRLPPNVLRAVIVVVGVVAIVKQVLFP
ncbi:sulfite exporter TauE/SafE family protein [Actinomycetota bacterium]